MIEFKKADAVTNAMEQKYIKVVNRQYQNTLRDIRKKIKAIYDRYGVDGKLDWDTLQKMAVMDKEEMTRLRKLEKMIDKDLAKLNRGRTQELKGYLTDVYMTNRDFVTDSLSPYGVKFDMISREAVYRSTVSPISANSLKDLTMNTRIKIRQSLTQGIIQGDSITRMAERIKGNLEGDAKRAVTIARTETTSSMNQGRQDVFEEASKKGLKLEKVWSAAEDSRTRPAHAEADGQQVPLDKPFIVDGERLMHPGDPSGSAKNIVNCRCSMFVEVID